MSDVTGRWTDILRQNKQSQLQPPYESWKIRLGPQTHEASRGFTALTTYRGRDGKLYRFELKGSVLTAILDHPELGNDQWDRRVTMVSAKKTVESPK